MHGVAADDEARALTKRVKLVQTDARLSPGEVSPLPLGRTILNDRKGVEQ